MDETHSIRHYPDPILRTPGKEVDSASSDISGIVDHMLKAMQDHGGVGLAAPQIGLSLRLFVMKPGRTPSVCINPVIFQSGKESEVLDEGCLSIPGVTVPVRRALEIEVRYTSMQGSVFRTKLRDFSARVFQHEMDHINGILVIDRTGPWNRWRSRNELRKLRNDSSWKNT